jgi:SAM-dependent methyltransferase
VAFESAYFARQYSETAGKRFSYYLRYAYWRRWMKKVGPPNARVLEIGSGLGHFGRQLPSLIETDISDFACRAMRRMKHQRIVRATAHVMPVQSEVLDFVFMFDILEHIQEPGTAIQEASRLLKQGGRMVLAVPNPEGRGGRFQGKNWIGYDDPTHCSLLRRAEWEDLVTKANLSIERSGTDFLWSPPYIGGVPSVLQKLVLLPVHQVVNYAFGMLPWKTGEMLVIEARKP